MTELLCIYNQVIECMFKVKIVTKNEGGGHRQTPRPDSITYEGNVVK